MAFAGAAPKTESRRCEETSSKPDSRTSGMRQNRFVSEKEGDENLLQNHLDLEREGDKGASTTTTSDRIIYFGIRTQAEGYVAEHTETRRGNSPMSGNADGEVPYSEDLTQGGEVLPSAGRNQNDISNNDCYHSADGRTKGKTGGSKHSNRQGFSIGGDC